MRLATIKHQGRETVAIVTARGLVTLDELNRIDGFPHLANPVRDLKPAG